MTLAASARAPRAARLVVANPFNGAVLSELAEASEAEVLATVTRARAAAAAFRGSTPYERRALLNRLAELVERDAEMLAQTISAEVGKTITEARGEARRAQNTLRLSGDAATFLDGEVLHCGIVSGGKDRQAVVTYVPTGVVAAITPFNYPVNLLCHKLGPAIAAGNAVVVKPSPKAPLAADHLVRLTREAGFPADLVQILHGGAEPALALARAPIDLLSFTGGPQAGLALKRASGLVRCLMELGGNDPLFVLPDADLDAAAATAVGHRFEIAGQSCAAVKKLYVHEAVQDEFTERLLALVADHRYGDPAEDATQMGPVIDAAAAADLAARLREAEAAGARLLAGGTAQGTLFAPTVIADVPLTTRLLASETFGPVLAMRTFSSLDAAMAEVNASEFGLQAGIFTNDHAAIRQLSRGLQVGGVMVNEGPDFRAEHVPFGGIKRSGLGREGVRIALREMSETRVVID
ncbi:aldehyde dehydrogenase family protein [Phaeovulum sp.]|uniref:aldehyde dehydrogenase family protein n=1 Tax=Phaeovulum sp. TaxID=2934796 RepID=UPI00272FBE19|nr:aldehyde dehydrogenase family protein [Phaeovulum sp.]MDP1667793.1 aldehyde dehydrogenase family protein [Phaeovulum sp.]MDZ4118975.1 aldehyde dehydrogenase family protein [Phaeovulum sp.]